ncbi:MAG: hypothetical protein ACFFA3_18760 [Promethearchaeota archaeon]
MVIKSKIKILFLIVICSIIVNATILFRESLDLANESRDESTKIANGDINPPLISFIKPDTNDTIITRKYFDIIVNITDENPPLSGNVSIEIFNSSISFFKASMIKFEEDQWFFTWDNVTSYTNERSYNFRVTAKDSSSNENTGISEVVSVFLDVYISRTPGLINGILYVIMASLIIAGIMAYFNKKRTLISHRKE